MERSQTSGAPPVSYGEPERTLIREHLEKILADPLFSHSKRYPNLLRYIVERTLEGRADDLKERTLGIEVFGRDPGYDTNADPIVRATAGEIRKRIGQYYHEHGNGNGIQIDLSPGSYVPEFRLGVKEPPSVPLTAPVALEPVPLPRRRLALLLVAVTAVALLAAGASWFLFGTPLSALDRFWRPVWASTQTVLLCVGQRSFSGSSPELPGKLDDDIARFAGKQADPAAPTTLFKLYYLGSQNVALPDMFTLGTLTGLLQAKGKTYMMRGQSSTTFADLRDGPVVLIGAFNNDWTLRLTGPMRFGFERENEVFRIHDRQHPTRKDRAVNYAMPYLQLTRDYALISRVLDPSTDRMVVVAGGLTGSGTIAAGEFLTNPAYMEAIAKDAPKNWWRKNIQIVITTEVINGHSGPPRPVELYFW